jgi:biotin carboxyl carrier protein
LFAKFNSAKGTAGKRTVDATSSTDGLPVSSPLSASVYKILVRPGDAIATDDTAVIELEAMKTSIMVPAGEGMGGKSVMSIAVQEGDSVDPGTVLVYIG